MRKLSLIAAFLLGSVFGGVVYAVNFTIVLTQAQVDIATWKWNQVDPPHLQFATAQLFGADAIGKLIEEWKNQRFVARKLYVGGPTGYYCVNTYPGQNTTQRNQVCTDLGDVAGCTVCDTNGN